MSRRRIIAQVVDVRAGVEWAVLVNVGHVFADIVPFFVDKPCNGIAKVCISNPVGAVGSIGQITARDFVAALGASFYSAQASRNRKVYGLVVTHFEVQKSMILYTTPVAAK